MYTLYKLSPTDLNENFLQALKLLFSGKTIEVSVREIPPTNESTDIWQAIQRFRQQMNPADFPADEDIFAAVRDRSAGREVVL
ncbi:hypothetical protein HMY34_04465 [Thiothrix subterranea]|uniref:hypothetical protein n=1 Tax=Thiothrix subterranea TaxID=2735563 RepID=UPI00192CC052|nr:hypothetical protein [Thiothrix subterranea]QQZ28069.1 hypothetical protein HMY34_04465 [Thiothrix subterranea]